MAPEQVDQPDPGPRVRAEDGDRGPVGGRSRVGGPEPCGDDGVVRLDLEDRFEMGQVPRLGENVCRDRSGLPSHEREYSVVELFKVGAVGVWRPDRAGDVVDSDSVERGCAFVDEEDPVREETGPVSRDGRLLHHCHG